ncbi:MAG: DUF1579 family protein [Anaerolineae bacterium]|nr:DUF1579 family protein [Anaerolineae bacterium]
MQIAHTEPHPMLRCLEMMVGTWRIDGREAGTEGEIHGQVVFEWMEGGFFLLQHVDLVRVGETVKGIEYIGYDEVSKTLKSHYFGTTGDLLEYVWEPIDYTLTIWVGEIGSPACYRSKFSNNFNTNVGRWEWPGGGYDITMTRVA